ncbi:isopentenyl-diphosphate Delta-isomerase [Klugiella xanthotipulae]|uniref:Isopentenyl-diphosphate Delta-isomerase n=1 Tax=Klugiella xanthotipulae TaxID=244735 RepID=A0A543HYR4_9MICO|nr:isopentenyl-diphosphate Delta-isomerase [Klugiella xanthotipulae]TQM63484.1 isopentenyl-diphosphate delta-isomerase [Klugiella xanthotipulae]
MSADTVDTAEDVVLVDDAGTPIGTASKLSIHGTDTALHLAFSCHLTNQHGEMLVTRRALSKAAWPGVWTNSFCGHPLPAESMIAAVERRAYHELGVTLERIEPILPLFRYRATDPSGVVENEICPVYSAYTTDALEVNPHEVVEHRWVRPDDLRTAVRAAPWAFSPWFVLQMEHLGYVEASSDVQPGPLEAGA